MRLVDLFCGAGGAAMGYYRAGFTDITGVDIKPQPRYPFRFIQADAMTFPLDGYDLIHASPPCQAFVDGARKGIHPDLIGLIRNRLLATGLPYVIENVDTAPLINPVMLCGTMFGLRVIRHRLFETVPAIFFPPFTCYHNGTVANGEFAPVYGHGGKGRRYVEHQKNGTYIKRRIGRAPEPCNKTRFCWWSESMGINWMKTFKELTEAIPPAYTEWIGKMIMEVK